MATPHEIEIKLDIDERHGAEMRSRLLTLLGPAHDSRPLVSVYFDTPDQTLRKQGIALRIRTEGDRHVQTVKMGEAGGGLFRRGEWETEVAGPALDAGALRHTPADAVAAGGGLAPTFETRIDRTTWQVERDGARIEVALDDGHVLAGTRMDRVLEVELELKDGRPAALFTLLREVDDGTRLRIGVRAKSERGFALLRRATRAHKAEPIALTAEMSAAAAFQAVMRSCIRQFRLNEQLLVATQDPEPLHQARVGLRRLRSALSLFRPIVADAAYGRLTEGLRSVSHRLGEARDLDVYLKAATEGEVPQPGVALDLTEIRDRRAAAYSRLIDTLEGATFRRLMLELLSWVEAGPWLLSDEPRRALRRQRPIRGVAADILNKQRRRVKRRGRHLDRLDPKQRHRVRIAAKTLRYATDFLATLPAGRKERDRHAAFTEALEALQKTLGVLNDAFTGRLLSMGSTPSATLNPEAPAAGGTLEWSDEKVDDQLALALKAHADFRRARRFWRRWCGDRS